MADEAKTEPTLETILEEMRAGFASIQHQLSQMDIRLDRIEGFANQTRSEVMYLRADFKEFRSEFNEFRSQYKQPA
jgi:chromosome segregation ATPase